MAPLEDALHRAQRLHTIIALLQAARHGLATKDLARRTGRTVRTIQRDLLELQTAPLNVPLETVGRRWRLCPGYQPDVWPVRLSFNEAVALFLAARLLHRTSDERNSHIAAALVRLADALPEPFAAIVRHDASIQKARSAEPAAVPERFGDLFATLAAGWAQRRTVQLIYRSREHPDPHTYRVDPYLMDSGHGLALYLFGYVHEVGQVRWFKLERIAGATLLDDTFAQPDIDFRSYLAAGWSILGGPGETEVRLRFGPAATRRLSETHWHPTQEIVEHPDGSCDFSVRVGYVTEWLYWILGWGGDCEVLAPTDLRERVASAAQQMVARYAVRG